MFYPNVNRHMHKSSDRLVVMVVSLYQGMIRISQPSPASAVIPKIVSISPAIAPAPFHQGIVSSPAPHLVHKS